MSKAPAKDGERNNFRMRRLSVSDGANEDQKTAAASPVPAEGGKKKRERRVSMSPEMGQSKPDELLPFKLITVGTYSCHGVEPGNRQGETHAKINQDRGSVVYPFGKDLDGIERALFIVMDGHGANGDKVSQFAMKTVTEEMERLDNENTLLEDNVIEEAFKKAFVTTDEKLRKEASIDAELSGTTAVGCLCVHNKKTGVTTLHSANAGDSRGVMQPCEGETVDLTHDQKPDTPDEKRRINRKGGFVSPPEEEWGGPARVWLDASMTLPGLAMARSIGDHLVKNIGVIAEPVVLKQQVDLKKDKFMVMASDGVWEFIESKMAAEIVTRFIDDSATVACQKLIETAAAKWREEEGDYRDDITAICVRFKDLFP